MTEVAIVRATGDGGYQDPTTGTYISSKNDSVVPFTPWVENLVNHERATLVRKLDGSNYQEFADFWRRHGGTDEEALKDFEEGREPSEQERVTVVETVADLEPRETEAPGRAATRTGKRKGAAAGTGEAEGETPLGERNPAATDETTANETAE